MSRPFINPAAAPSGIFARLNAFFYAEQSPYGLALTRMLLPWAVLIAAFRRWPHARELYSTDGAAAPLWNGYGLGGMLPEPNGPIAVALFTMMICLLITTSIGWHTRWSVLIGGALYAWFGTLDSVSTLTKYTVVAVHAFLILGVSRCGDVWSVDAWLARRETHRPSHVAVPRSAVWPQRLIQLLVGIIYLGSAATKMHTPAYFSGDQLMYWMITDINFHNPLGEILSLYPWMLVVISYLTIVWEMLFIFLCWRGTSRVVMLGLGVVFHAMTWFTLGLLEFPLIYGALYCAFLTPAEVERAMIRLRHRWRRLTVNTRPTLPLPTWWRALPTWCGPAHSAAAFALLLALTAVAGVEAEYQADPYGLRRPEGPHALQPVTPDRLAALLAPAEPLAPRDKLFAFEVGTVTVGGVLADRRARFDYGERAVIQCSLQPLHEDLWVEVNLHDANGRIIEQNGIVVPRENLRGSFHYDMLPALRPGDYWLVLRLEGREVARRRITLRDSN